MNPSRTPAESNRAAYERIQNSRGVLRLDDAAALEFTGADRLEWLQGQVTQDLRNLAEGDTVGFCLCKPSGQMLTAGRLAVLAKRVVAVVPQSTVQAVLSRVDEAVFLEDVAVRTLTGHTVWTLLGPDSPAALGLPGADRAFELRHGDVGGVALPTDRARTGGFDLVLADGATPESALLVGENPALTAQSLEVVRLEAGVPRWGADMDDRVLPPEMGPHFESGHVSFGKGCYTGQEILMRIHSRGHANRMWVGLIADGPVAACDRVVREGEECGVVTSAASSRALGFVAGAMLRKEAAKPGEMVGVITPSATVRAEVRPMPLLPPR